MAPPQAVMRLRSCDLPRAREATARIDVQPAFLHLTVFPPPAAGALVFVRERGPRAGRAPYGAIALLIKAVVRNFARAQVCPDVLRAPVRERIELEHAVNVVVLERSQSL